MTMIKIGISDFSTKLTKYYNLDVIISVGYRVKSHGGVHFRKWVTALIKEYDIYKEKIKNRIYKVKEDFIKHLEITSKKLKK